MVRLKTRYILFEILYPPSELNISQKTDPKNYLLSIHQSSSPQLINTKILLKAIRSSIETHFGVYGSGVTGSNLVLKYFSNATSTGIIRCSRDYYKIVCAALVLINAGAGQGAGIPQNCTIRVIKISGTIKKCEMFAIKKDKELMHKMNRNDINQILSIGDNNDDEVDVE